MRKKRYNGNAEGQAERTVSNGEYQRSFSEPEGSSGNAEPTAAAGIGAELRADYSPPDRGSNTASGSDETAPRKRGRPKGSTNASKRESGTELARRKLSGGFTGLVAFGFSGLGHIRASKYKKINANLANGVYNCYQIGEEEAKTVGEPLADTFIEWFPGWVSTATKVVDPSRLIGALYFLMKNCQDNEAIVIERYNRQFIRPTEEDAKYDTNGTAPNTDHLADLLAESGRGMDIPTVEYTLNPERNE